MRPHRRLSDVSNVSNVSIVTRHSYISQGTRHSNVSRNTYGLTQDELREAARQDREERAQREAERAKEWHVALARADHRRELADGERPARGEGGADGGELGARGARGVGDGGTRRHEEPAAEERDAGGGCGRRDEGAR